MLKVWTFNLNLQHVITLICPCHVISAWSGPLSFGAPPGQGRSQCQRCQALAALGIIQWAELSLQCVHFIDASAWQVPIDVGELPLPATTRNDTSYQQHVLRGSPDGSKRIESQMYNTQLNCCCIELIHYYWLVSYIKFNWGNKLWNYPWTSRGLWRRPRFPAITSHDEAWYPTWVWVMLVPGVTERVAPRAPWYCVWATNCSGDMERESVDSA